MPRLALRDQKIHWSVVGPVIQPHEPKGQRAIWTGEIDADILYRTIDVSEPYVNQAFCACPHGALRALLTQRSTMQTRRADPISKRKS